MVVYYNCQESVLRSFFRWKHTLTKSLLTGFEFWSIVGIALVVTMLLDFEVVQVPQGLKDLELTPLLGPVFSMAIFTAVFYNGQCYQRYNGLYQDCMDIDLEVKGLVAEILSDFSFDPSLRRHILLCTKYLIASAFFLHLSVAPQLKDEEWNRFSEKGLLSKTEIEVVRRFPCQAVLLLHHWVQRVAGAAIAEPCTKERYSPPERASMENRIYAHVDRLSAACCRIANTLNLPVPFPYFHLLQFLIVLTAGSAGLLCCILASKVPTLTYALGVLPVAVMTFAMLALRNLAGELSNPFGEDGVDFPSYDFMRHIQDHCVAMLQAELFYNPLEGLDSAAEFDGLQVAKPCNPRVDVAPELSNCRTSKYLDGGAQDEQRARAWRTPEDYESGLKLKRWLESLQLEGANGKHADSGAPVRTLPWLPFRAAGSLMGSPVADMSPIVVKGIAGDGLGPAKE